MKSSKSALFGLVVLVTSTQVYAMGSSPVVANGNGGTDPVNVIGQITGALQLNPYVSVLQSEFAGAIKPVGVNRANGLVTIGDNIQMDRRYDCRIYYALSQKNALTPSTTTTWYRFSKYGELFLDNQSYIETGRIRTFAANPLIEGELWGQSDDKTVYEAIRVTRAGDLIIETFTPEASWTRAILGSLGLDGNIAGLASQIQGMQLPAVVAGVSGSVLSYTYCPHDHVSAVR